MLEKRVIDYEVMLAGQNEWQSISNFAVGKHLNPIVRRTQTSADEAFDSLLEIAKENPEIVGAILLGALKVKVILRCNGLVVREQRIIA